MLMGLNTRNELVYAQHAKSNELYRCPECNSELILRRGKHTIAHFAHKSNSYCLKNVYKKETLAHLASKHHIYSSLNKKVQIDMEYYLHEIEQIPDILINRNLVIEFQYSPINLELLGSRTAGFRALNLNVIWISKPANEYNRILKLSYFEAALINHTHRTLITYDYNRKLLIKYDQLQSLDVSHFIFRKNIIKWEDLLQAHNVSRVPTFLLNDNFYNNYLGKCRQTRSVLEPTLSLLYQSGLIHKNRPKFLGIIVPEQLYILTNAITWQCYLYLEINKGTFTFERFNSFIKFRTFNNVNYSKEDILKSALKSYLSILNKMTLSRAKK
ncbi:Competence protein CoiA [Mammaliicoccus lentus]|uniref:competence protein CoiA n=1 Tax=Mammaliicoccus lentus TaxID=42858 RepID=UPI0039EC6AEE